jgi:iron(III) transport system substrate-binding protein
VSAREVPEITGAFEKKYPGIKVQALQMNASQIPPRVITEQRASKYVADVISGNSSYLWQLKAAGAYQPYDAPDAGPQPAGLDLPDGYRGVIYAVTDVMSYNPAALAAKHIDPPKTWEDLTKPEWKGNFSVNPQSVGWYMALIQQMGHDKALALVKALASNSPLIVTSHTLADTQVEGGEPLATASGYGYDAASFAAKDPQHITFVNTNPLPTEVDLVNLAKNAPHPAAARVLADWIQSQEGQSEIVKVSNEVSLRTDVDNNPDVWDLTKWKPVFSPVDISSDDYNKYLKEYQAAVHAS